MERSRTSLLLRLAIVVVWIAVVGVALVALRPQGSPSPFETHCDEEYYEQPLVHSRDSDEELVPVNSRVCIKDGQLVSWTSSGVVVSGADGWPICSSSNL